MCCLHIFMWISAHVLMHGVAGSGCQMFFPDHSPPYFLRQGHSLLWASLTSWIAWPMSSGNLPASPFVTNSTPSFLYACWGSEPRSSSLCASSLLTGPSLQPQCSLSKPMIRRWEASYLPSLWKLKQISSKQPSSSMAWLNHPCF